jgi:SWI/SNF-related matrix-associated actin-dependent regulator 1 of chromatin subfamily A
VPRRAALHAAWDAPFVPLLETLLTRLAHGTDAGTGVDGTTAALRASSPPGSPRRPGSPPRGVAASGEPPGFVWIDALCLPQHGRAAASAAAEADHAAAAAAADADGDDCGAARAADAAHAADAGLHAWAAAVRDCGALAVVLSPWRLHSDPNASANVNAAAALRPLPLARGWCIYEAATALREGAQVSFLLPAAERAWLACATLHGSYEALRAGVTSIDLASAPVTEPAASRAIAAAARRAGSSASGGDLRSLDTGGSCAAMLDAAVRRATAGWLLDGACAALLGPMGPTGSSGAVSEGVLRSVANHCIASGRLRPAEALLRALLSRARASAGDASPNALDAFADLAALLQAQERLSEAEVLLRAAVAAGRRARGHNHLCTLAAEAQLANVERAMGTMCLRRFTRLVCNNV